METKQATDKYSEGIDVVLGRSRRTEALVALGALATALLVASLPLELELQAPALAWIAYASNRALRKLRRGVRVKLDGAGAIEVGKSAGSARDGSFVAPWLTVIRWRPLGAWRDRSLLVAPDMLGAEDFRRLRVLLRWG